MGSMLIRALGPRVMPSERLLAYLLQTAPWGMSQGKERSAGLQQLPHLSKAQRLCIASAACLLRP